MGNNENGNVGGSDHKKHTRLTRDILAQYVKGEHNHFFVEQLFALIGEKEGGGGTTINWCQLVEYLEAFVVKDEREKVRVVFDLYDLNGDGALDREELIKMFKISMEENNLKLGEPVLSNLVDTLLLHAGKVEGSDTAGASLDFADFCNLTGVQQPLVNRLSLLSEMLLETMEQESKAAKMGWSCSCSRISSKLWETWRFWARQSAVLVSWITAFFLINLFILGLKVFPPFINWGGEMGDGGGGGGCGGGVEENLEHEQFASSVARGCGQCLTFSSIFILFTMMRLLLTKIHCSWMHPYFPPINEHKRIHRIVGRTIVAATVGHVGGHLIHLQYVVREGEQWDWVIYMFSLDKSMDLGLIPGFAYISGILLILALLPLVLLSCSYVRRKGYFQVFHVSHNVAYPIYYFLLIIHCRNFWKWVLIPGTFFLIEQVRRTYLKYRGYQTVVEFGSVLPSNVISLGLKRPDNFNFRPGDYIYIRIPKISYHEWHAFTISSAPENYGELMLHIRVVGPWTKKLYKEYEAMAAAKEKQQQQQQLKSSPPNFKRSESKSLEWRRSQTKTLPPEAETVMRRTKSLTPNARCRNSDVRGVHNGAFQLMEKEQKSCCEHEVIQLEQDPPEIFQFDKPLTVYIDGPHGAPASNIFQAQHAVIICTGIGVTPFASILESMVFRHRKTKVSCPACTFTFSPACSTDFKTLKSVDFYWLNGERECFFWFFNLLLKLEDEQHEDLAQYEDFLSIHLYMTRALQGTKDVKLEALRLAMELFYKKNQRDCLSNLKARMKTGRPDWNAVFSQIKEKNNKGQVSIFFCGPKKLKKELKNLSLKYGFVFRAESF